MKEGGFAAVLPDVCMSDLLRSVILILQSLLSHQCSPGDSR